VRRISKFVVVGAGNTALSLVLFNLLIAATSLPASMANAIAYAFGIANSYYWNRRWTFSDSTHLPRSRTLPRFVATNLGGLLITTGLVAVLEAFAVSTSLFDGAARVLVLNGIEVVALAVGLAWNFTLSRFWVFAVRDSG
jgi:putative flippase GtrA